MKKCIFNYVSGAHNALDARGPQRLAIWVLLLIPWNSSTINCTANAFTFHLKQPGIVTKRSANPLVPKPKLQSPANPRKETKNIRLLDTIFTGTEDTNFSEHLRKDFWESNSTMNRNHLLDGRDLLELNYSSKKDWNVKLHQHSFMWLKAENEPSILISFPTLWAICRPNNFIGILMLHTLGTYLAINRSNTYLVKTLLHPQQIAVLLALLLTSATSMMVNDYYDIRSGVDSHKVRKPKAPPRVMKRVLGLLYAPLLLITAVVPGISARLILLSGAMLTFLYTEHLKPVTWVKTIICALLIAISPLTSGLAAISLGFSPPSKIMCKFSIDNSLLRLVTMLFCGFFWTGNSNGYE